MIFCRKRIAFHFYFLFLTIIPISTYAMLSDSEYNLISFEEHLTYLEHASAIDDQKTFIHHLKIIKQNPAFTQDIVKHIYDYLIAYDAEQCMQTIKNDATLESFMYFHNLVAPLFTAIKENDEALFTTVLNFLQHKKITYQFIAANTELIIRAIVSYDAVSCMSALKYNAVFLPFFEDNNIIKDAIAKQANRCFSYLIEERTTDKGIILQQDTLQENLLHCAVEHDNAFVIWYIRSYHPALAFMLMNEKNYAEQTPLKYAREKDSSGICVQALINQVDAAPLYCPKSIDGRDDQ